MELRALVIGQGYVGLPVAIRAVEVGHRVTGFDVDKRRVDRLRSGDSFVEDVDSEQLNAALASGRYLVTDVDEACAGFDVAVITVPTPLRSGTPDLSFIEEAGRALARHVRAGTCVILESTTYPGTTQELLAPILEAGSGLMAGRDFHLGYSPERIDPQVTPRIYGLAEVPVSRGDLHGSGDATFDRALSVTLLKLSETFSVLPGFAFSERIRLNAFASSNQALGREDGSVVFGNPLYREIMGRREHPEVGIVAVCAHEFGHIAQFKRGIHRILISEKRVKRLELHADFLAGYFAGRRKLEMPEFPAAIFATTPEGS